MLYVVRISASRATEGKLCQEEKLSLSIYCLVGFKLLILPVPTCCSVLLNNLIVSMQVLMMRKLSKCFDLVKQIQMVFVLVTFM